MRSSHHSFTASTKIFFAALRSGKKPDDLGFSPKATKGDISRFISRYRVAEAFKGISLEGFSRVTTDGYSALLKLFLVWSSFEQFLDIVGWKQKDEIVKDLFDRHGADILCEQIRKYDRRNKFYLFVSSQVNDTHKSEIDKLFQDRELNSSYLASAIRHIFAHGKLTPHANKTYPQSAIAICNLISEFLLHLIDAEFSKRLDELIIQDERTQMRSPVGKAAESTQTAATGDLRSL